jgi:ketosteroid isomerase-like protein
VAGVDARHHDLAALHAGPAGTSRIFAEALLAGDVRAAARCFDPRGSILTADGTEVSGVAGIAEILGQIADSKARLRIRVARTLRAGPVAMATQIWDRDIGGSTASSTARLVLHESAGRWSILIAAPWGSR